MSVSPRDVILKSAPDGAPAEAVSAAVAELFAHDAALFQVDANERSITHRLALHMTPRFPKWHVDCEYNRDGFDPKMLHGPGAVEDVNETNGSRGYQYALFLRFGSATTTPTLERIVWS